MFTVTSNDKVRTCRGISRRDLFRTLSGRFNYSAQSLQDQLGGALSGDNRFHRLNPAVGLSGSR